MIKEICLIIISMFCTAGAIYGKEPADSIEEQKLSEIVVTGNSARGRIDNPRLGAERLELSKLVKTPSLAGENDILKSIALLPGIRHEGDGGGGFEVRGGNASQNLILLDGITLYNPTHVLGIFSTFNDNALASATIYKGPIPATYGEATSSVLETSLMAGDMEKYHGSATIGILAAKIKAEGPIVKDKLSFAITGRRSYIDAFLKMVPQYRSTIMNFYDATTKLRYRPSATHLIDISFFTGRDNMAVSDLMGYYWGNLGASANWVARKGESISFTTTASLNYFRPKMSMDIMDFDQVMRTYIRNYSVNEKIHWQFNPNHGLELGLRTELLRVKSAEWTVNSSTEKEIRSILENSVWFDYSGNISGKTEISAGLRCNISSVLSAPQFHEFISTYNIHGNFNSKNYFNAEPRVSMKYNFSQYNNLKVGVGISTQNLHSIRSSATSFPFDRYALTSADVKPEHATQYGIGYNGMTRNGDFDWSVEGYYKTINNVYDYKDGRSSFSDIALENIILGGKGRSYGMEFMIRKNSGRLTGWISYTLSRTETKIPGINEGQWYNATNDRRHDFSITAIYKISDKWNVSGSWIYLSGQPLTAPDVKYEISGETCYYYSKRNSYMTPPTHRLDLSATYSHIGRKFTYEWSFGIYNAYCRYNPYIVYFEDDPSKYSGTRAVQQAMYGLIPSVSYTLKF